MSKTAGKSAIKANIAKNCKFYICTEAYNLTHKITVRKKIWQKNVKIHSVRDFMVYFLALKVTYYKFLHSPAMGVNFVLVGLSLVNSLCVRVLNTLANQPKSVRPENGGLVNARPAQ